MCPDLFLAISFLAMPVCVPATGESPDLRHFPPLPENWQDENRAFQHWCLIAAALYPAKQAYYGRLWEEARECEERHLELEHVRSLWRAHQKELRDPRLTPSLVWDTWKWYMDALERLEYLLGREAYILGDVGPILPLWHFVRE